MGDCTAEIHLKAKKKRSVLEITRMDPLDVHCHFLTPECLSNGQEANVNGQKGFPVFHCSSSDAQGSVLSFPPDPPVARMSLPGTIFDEIFHSPEANLKVWPFYCKIQTESDICYQSINQATDHTVSESINQAINQ